MENQIKFSHWTIDHLLETGLVDAIDAQILDHLTRNSRQSLQKIASAIGIKRTTCHDRIQRLIDRKIITDYTVKLNLQNSGISLKAFVFVSFDPSRSEGYDQRSIAKKISRFKYVISVDIITGNYDFFIRVGIDSMESLSELILEELNKLPGITRVQTMISFQEYRFGRSMEKKIEIM